MSVMPCRSSVGVLFVRFCECARMTTCLLVYGLCACVRVCVFCVKSVCVARMCSMCGVVCGGMYIHKRAPIGPGMRLFGGVLRVLVTGLAKLLFSSVLSACSPCECATFCFL